MEWIVIMRDWQWHITVLLISRYWSVHVCYNGAPPSEAVWGWEDVKWSQNFFCVYEAVGPVHGRAGSQAMHFRSLVGISSLIGNMACAFYQHPKMWQFIASDTCHVPALYWSCPSEPTIDHIIARIGFPQRAPEKQPVLHTLLAPDASCCLVNYNNISSIHLYGHIMKLIYCMWQIYNFSFGRCLNP